MEVAIGSSAERSIDSHDSMKSAWSVRALSPKTPSALSPSPNDSCQGDAAMTMRGGRERDRPGRERPVDHDDLLIGAPPASCKGVGTQESVRKQNIPDLSGSRPWPRSVPCYELVATIDAVVVSPSPALGVLILSALPDGNALVHHVAAVRAASHRSIGAAVVVVGAAPTSRSQLLLPRPSFMIASSREARRSWRTAPSLQTGR